MLGTTVVSNKPAASDAAARNATGRGPILSASAPVNGPSKKLRLIVMPNTTAVAPLPALNSSVIDSKNAPKL